MVTVLQSNGEKVPGQIIEVTHDQSQFLVKPSIGDRTLKTFITTSVLNRARELQGRLGS
jgi:hypothetical protein